VHDEVLRYRNRIVAHRVDKKTEWTRVSLVYREGNANASAVRIRVAIPYGPEEERLAVALGELAKGLKDRLWQQWFPRLEAEILESLGSDANLRKMAEWVGDEDGSFVTIKPTGDRL
jgi:hypothetical protein